MERDVARIRKILLKLIDVSDEALDDDLDLIDEGLVDSLLALQILNALEREFDVLIPSEDVGNYVSVNTIATGIERLKARQSGSPVADGADDEDGANWRVSS
jgi:acyl carrier protein